MIASILILIVGIVIGMFLGVIAYAIADGLLEIDLSKPHDKFD